MSDTEQCFKTTDLYFAAFLRVADIRFVDCLPLEGQGPRKVFLFENSPEIRDLKNIWFRGEKVNISPLKLAREIKSLKDMIHM